MKNWIEVGNYLDDIEANNLLSSLRASGARADKIGCGPVSLLGFYKFKTVRVAKTDTDKASSVIDNFQRQIQRKKELLEERKHKCPKCGSVKIKLRKLNFLKRIYFLGVKPVCCEECKYEWET